jgi:5'-nucleotidase
MILVTNDDGVSPGLEILLSAASSLSQVCSIIPARQQSAVGKSMTFHKALRVQKSSLGKFPIYEISGTPADAISFALHYRPLFPKCPSLTVAGINSGYNLSLHSLYSSGTIGACIESALNGVPAIAFSSQRCCFDCNWDDPKNWQPRSKLLPLCKYFISNAQKHGLPPGCDILSINFPRDLSRAKIAVCEPQSHVFDVRVEKRIDPDGSPYYWMAGSQLKPERHDRDVSQLLSKQNITITPISLGACEAELCLAAKKYFSNKRWAK